MMYARVGFVKDDKEQYVPCSFIRNFDPNNFDKSFKYWVFWSGFANDSPDEMLKKVPEIPRYDDTLEPSTPPIDASFKGAGYHRAIVLATGASVDDIKHMKKRASIVPRKFLEDHNSFEINPKTSKVNGSKKKKRSGNSGEVIQPSAVQLKKLKENAKQRDLEEIRLQVEPNKKSSYSNVDLPLEVLIHEGGTALELEDDHVSSAQAEGSGSYGGITVKEEIVDDGKKSSTEKKTEKSGSEQEGKSSSEKEDSSTEEEEDQSSREQEKSDTPMISDEEESDEKKSQKSSSEEEGERRCGTSTKSGNSARNRMKYQELFCKGIRNCGERKEPIAALPLAAKKF